MCACARACVCAARVHDCAPPLACTHRRAELIGDPTDAKVGVRHLELVVGGYLRATHQHRPHGERLHAAVEGAEAILLCDPHDRVEDVLVASLLIDGQRRVVGHTDQADLDRARDHGRTAARDRRRGEALRKVCLAVLGAHVPELLKQTVARGRVEHLTQAPSAQPVIQRRETLRLDQLRRKLSKGELRSGIRTHRCQIHPDGQRVEGVHAHPARDATQAGCTENHTSRQRLFCSCGHGERVSSSSGYRVVHVYRASQGGGVRIAKTSCELPTAIAYAHRLTKPPAAVTPQNHGRCTQISSALSSLDSLRAAAPSVRPRTERAWETACSMMSLAPKLSSCRR